MINSDFKDFVLVIIASQFGGQLVLRGVPLQDRRKSDLSDHLCGSRTVWNGNRVLPSRVTSVHRFSRPVHVLCRTIYLHETKNGYDIMTTRFYYRFDLINRKHLYSPALKQFTCHSGWLRCRFFVGWVGTRIWRQ